MKEEWKPVYEFDGLYEVSSLARIRSLDRTVRTKNKLGVWTTRRVKGRILSPSIDAAGYRRVGLAFEGKQKYALVHRIFALAFLPNPDNKPHINHIDSNPLNNSLENLEWCTHKENMAHAVAAGRMKQFCGTEKGERCPSSKLRDSDVVEIKRRLAAGETPKQISNDYPVTNSAISEIKAGRAWSHIS